MLKKLLLFTFFGLMPICITAQENENDYELRSNEKKGWIIDKDGNKIEGIVKLMGDKDSPWDNQLKVRFIANSDIDSSKKRQKLKVLDADDLKAYAAYDDDVLREFELISYKNFREASKNDGGGIGGKIKMIKNISQSSYIAEVLVKGPVTVYRLYALPTSVAVGEKDIQQMEKDIRDIKNNPSILVSKNGSRVEELNSSDFKKFTEDCDFVRTKMKNKEYASYNPEKEEKKKSKLGALIKTEAELNGFKVQSMAYEIFADYNANCGK